MTTDSEQTTATTTIDCIPSEIARLMQAEYPETLAAIGLPVCCVHEAGMWAVPVSFNCGTYHVAFCRVDAATIQLVSPSPEVREALGDGCRLPSLVIDEGTLHIIVHTSTGDRSFPF